MPSSHPGSLVALRRVVAVFLFTLSLAACGGGGGGGGGDPQPENKSPVADAGIDIALRAGEEVELDGSLSADEDGTLQSFQWTQTAGEPAVELVDAGSAVTRFTAPDVQEDTVFTFELTVIDNDAAQDTDTVDVTVFRHIEGNKPPEPVVAQLPGVEPGAPALLDASSSLDEDGTVVAYEWRQVAGPVVELAGADTALASFVAPQVDVETTLLFRLVVTDDRGERNALDVEVVVGATVNQPPVGDAGDDQVVNAGETVQLNGTGSQDPEDETLTYDWTQVGGNEVFDVTFDDPASPTPSFTAPAGIDAELVLVFELAVTDLAGQQGKDSVAVTVSPLVEGNQLPIAVAGGPVSPVDGGQERALLDAGSSDPDGSIVAYRWRQVSGPDAQLIDADQERARFIAPFVPEETIITFRLTVTDDAGAVAHDDIDVTINAGQPVTAVAKANGNTATATVIEGDSVVLDGRESISLTGSALTYTWEASGGIELAVDPVEPAIARFTAPAEDSDSTYTFTLTVDDGTNDDSDTVSVTVKANRPPVVDAGSDLTVNAGDAVTLNGNADDPEGRPLAIQWQQVEAEGVPQMVLAGADTREPTFTAPADITEAVTLQFRMSATDDEGQATEDTVAVTVNPVVAGNQPPVAVAQNQVVDESAQVTLDGSASDDPDGDNANLAFEWTQVEIPEGQQPVTLSDPNAAAPTFTALATAVDLALKFRLIVTDEQNAVSEPIIVTVTIQDTGPDVVPDEMVFEPVTDVELRETVSSDALAVTGIDTAAVVHLSVDADANLKLASGRIIRSDDGGIDNFLGTQTVNPGDRIQFSTQFDADALGGTVRFRLVFGDPASPDYETSWIATAKTEGDQDPVAASFTFPDVADLTPGENHETELVTPEGFDTASPITIVTNGSGTRQAVSPSGSVIQSLRPGESFKVRIRPNSGQYEAQGDVTVTIGNTSTSFVFSTRAKDETPALNPDAIPAQTGLEPLVEATTDIVVSDFDETLPVSVAGPVEADAAMAVSTDAGATFGEFASSGDVAVGDVVRIRALSPAFNEDGSEAQHAVTLTVGTESREFVVGTRAPDRVPDAFSIPPAADAAVGAPVRSAPFIIPGIEVPVPVSLTGDVALSPVLYINGEPTQQDPMAGPDDELLIEILSPDATSETVSVTLTAGSVDIGQASADFVVTTSDTDTTPDAFSFVPGTDIGRGELAESDPVTIAGLSDGVTATVTVSGDADAAYAVQRAGGGAFEPFSTEPGEVGNGDQLKVRVRASEAFDTDTAVVLEVGGRTAEFVVTSEADSEAPIAEITFPINGGMFNADEVDQLTVHVDAEDEDSVAGVMVNGFAAELDGISGQWSVTVPVVAGENSLAVTVSDPSGNAASPSITVYGETGMFGDMRDMLWAGGKLYALGGDTNLGRIIEIDPATGERHIKASVGLRFARVMAVDDRDDPSTLFTIGTDGRDVHTIDLVGGSETVFSVVGDATMYPYLGIAAFACGSSTCLLNASLSSPDGKLRLILINADGSSDGIDIETAYWKPKAVTVHDGIGWLFATTPDVSEMALLRLDLSDLANISLQVHQTFSSAELSLINRHAPVKMRPIPSGGAAPDFLLAGHLSIIRINGNDGTVDWITGQDTSDEAPRGSGPLPEVRSFYGGLDIDDTGQLFVMDPEWSAVMRVDMATGDREPLTGHYLTAPDDLAQLPGASAPLGVLPDGSLVIERDQQQMQPTFEWGVDHLARYNSASARWEYLEGSAMENLNLVSSQYAPDLIPVSQGRVFVASNQWLDTNGFPHAGLVEVVLNPDSGNWAVNPFSLSEDGKLPEEQAEDLDDLKAAALHPATGDIWVLDQDTIAERFRLWRIPVAGEDAGTRYLEMILPVTIDGATPRTSRYDPHPFGIARDGRFLWQAMLEGGGTALFEIKPNQELARVVSDPAGFDMAIDETMQLAYFPHSYVEVVDILSGSDSEGERSSLPPVAYPDFRSNVGSGEKQSAFDEERRRLWVYSSNMRTVYLIQPDTGDAVMLPKH